MSKSNTVDYYRLLFSARDTFLSGNARLENDINYFIQYPVNIEGRLKEFHTLLVDLRLPLEKIWSGIYHRARAEIRSFINNQCFEYEIVSNLSPAELSFFIDLFDTFASAKNILKAEKARLRAYNKAGLLAISFIKQNGNYVSVNFYRLSAERAANIYSFNIRSAQNNGFSNSHLGRAHRTLHWLDMLKFKNSGVNYYDFCGWYNGTKNKTLLNINKFKEQFTNHKVVEYSGVIVKSRLLLLIRKLKKMD